MTSTESMKSCRKRIRSLRSSPVRTRRSIRSGRRPRRTDGRRVPLELKTFGKLAAAMHIGHQGSVFLCQPPQGLVEFCQHVDGIRPDRQAKPNGIAVPSLGSMTVATTTGARGPSRPGAAGRCRSPSGWPVGRRWSSYRRPAGHCRPSSPWPASGGVPAGPAAEAARRQRWPRSLRRWPVVPAGRSGCGWSGPCPSRPGSRRRGYTTAGWPPHDPGRRPEHNRRGRTWGRRGASRWCSPAGTGR